MERVTFPRLGAALVAAAALMAAQPASAQLAAGSVECRAGIAKAYAKLLKTANQAVAACHKARDKGSEPAATDCNDLATADLKGKYPAAVTKFVDAVAGACEGQDDVLTAASDGAGREYYVSCPVDPCTDVAGVLDSMAEVGACLACVAADVAGDVGAATLGSPDPTGLDADERRCRGAIAKGYGRYLAAAFKGETSCQLDQDEAGNDALETCRSSLAGDPKGRAASALSKAAAGLDKACVTALTDLDGCSAVDVDSLKTCTAAAWSGAEDDAFVSGYELPALVCPAAIRATIHAGCGTEASEAGSCDSGFESATVLSQGWNGQGHGMDVTDAFTLAVDVSCAGSDAGSCGICTTTGVSDDNPQHASFTRCLDDPSVPCSNPFGMDPACNGGSGGPCKYFLGPPLNDLASGTPLCTLNVLQADIVGATMDAETGAADLTLELRSIVYTGVSVSRPCPYCRNDATPQDGQADGTCFDGPRDGEPCDVQGFDLTFAPVDDVLGPTSGVSLDCPPHPGSNSSGSGLAITLPLTTGTSTKGADDACEFPNESLDCFCGLCSGDATVSCSNDADCSTLGLGNCGSAPGIDRKPNNCTDGICYPVPGQSDRGACSSDVAMTPDQDSFCSGVLRANGSGTLHCGTNADCSAYVTGSTNPDHWVCPSDDCGTCSVSTVRSCFLDPIEISGSPDPANPTLAATFCLQTLSSAGKNASRGYPGPGSIRVETSIEPRY